MVTHFCNLASRFSLRNLLWPSPLVRNFCAVPKNKSTSTVDNDEVKKFTEKANKWWEEEYSVLRSMNTLRVPLVRDGILSVSGIKPENQSFPLKGIKILDVGCGGGILAEPLARLGASVTGLDPGQENIEAAIEHSLKDEEAKERLTYVCDTIEGHSKSFTDKYDAVICSEVIEHVANVNSFVSSCVDITRDGGSIFFTTINRTTTSYLAAILGAEYVLNIVPRGTHDWNKFITPQELSNMLQSLNCRVVSVGGMFYNPLTKRWSFCDSSSNLYALHAVK